jgi:hypothetical protein
VPENGTGELHYVCTQTDGQMHHYRRDFAGWTHQIASAPASTAAPCLIEGTYGVHDEIGSVEAAWWTNEPNPTTGSGRAAGKGLDHRHLAGGLPAERSRQTRTCFTTATPS